MGIFQGTVPPATCKGFQQKVHSNVTFIVKNFTIG